MILGADRHGDLASAASAAPTGFDTVVRGGDDIAAFLCTSCTTGRSKGAVLDWMPRTTTMMSVPTFYTRLLADQPGVAESSVAVLVADGVGPDPDALRAAVVVAVAERLARFKHPRHYELVEAPPRNTIGKVQKNARRQRFAGLFSPRT